MSDRLRFPPDPAGFAVLSDGVERVVDTSSRLPQWPLRHRRTAHVDVCQYSHAIEGSFAPVLQSLADFHGDVVVTTLVLEPKPAYYREHYGGFSAFLLPRGDVSTSFWDCVSYEPAGDPTGALINTANVVATVGSSGVWAVWAERSWDLAIVLSDTVGGPWLSQGVPFVPIEVALADFTEPDFKKPLSNSQRSAFLANFSSHPGATER